MAKNSISEIGIRLIISIFSFIVALILLGMLFALALLLRALARRQKENRPLTRALLRISRPLLFCSIVNFMLLGFRELGAAVLSARIWPALVDAISVIWFALVFQAIRLSYTEETARLEDQRKYREYLPKKKK